MIGLKRGTVRLVNHQRSWATLFAKESRAIRRQLGPVVKDIQHIGSTAIPGIQAKPILDLLLGVGSLHRSVNKLKSLRSLGYVQRPMPRKNKWQRLYVKGPEQRRTVYLHIVRYGGAVWGRDIYFRDHLRASKRLARQYEQLKRRLSKLYPQERAKYTAGKLPFIVRIQSGYRTRP